MAKLYFCYITLIKLKYIDFLAVATLEQSVLDKIGAKNMSAEIQERYDSALNAYIAQYPVPVISIAKHMGIEVFETPDFDDSISGELTKNNDKFEITLNSNHAPTRRRFTLAHEIGHYVLHQNEFTTSQTITDYKVAMQRSTNSYLPEQRMLEVEANQFAAKLLMPDEEFIQKWQDGLTISRLADYFFVSENTANIRAYNLGLIS